MSEKVPVSSREEFVQAVLDDEYNQLDEAAIEELWKIWDFRHSNGTGEVLVSLPEWFSQNEFEIRRPFFLAQIEYDDPSKGAVLYSSAMMVDISIVENKIWDQVSIDETLDVLDISEGDDYIDEPGKIWIPRSLSQCYMRK